MLRNSPTFLCPPPSEMAADRAFKVSTSSFPRHKLSSDMGNTVLIDVIKFPLSGGRRARLFPKWACPFTSPCGVAEVQGC